MAVKGAIPVEISASCLAVCFLRTYFIPAAFNPRGLQNIPFMRAIDPALRQLYPDRNMLENARKRHVARYNCHPFFTPLVLGITLAMEKEIAMGRIPAQASAQLRDTTANTLSALGDSFFSGSVLGLWALASVFLLLNGCAAAALCLALFLFTVLQLFKAASFALGYRRGFSVLNLLGKVDLINLADLVKCANALLLTGCLIVLFPGGEPVVWIAGTGALGVCAFLAARHPAARMIVVLILMALLLVKTMGGMFLPFTVEFF